MASSASLASNINAPSGHAQTSMTAQSNGAGKATMKTSAKSADGGRKQSPADASGKRAHQSKPWTSGTNPLTQKPSVSLQLNGNTPQLKQGVYSKAAVSREAIFSDRHANERFKFIMTAAIGTVAVITTKTGDKFEGAFSGTSNPSSATILSLKMAKRLNDTQGGQMNGLAAQAATFTGSGPHYTMDFDIRDVADLFVSELKLPDITNNQNGTTPNFQTDKDISGNLGHRERELKPWMPDTGADIEMSLEANGPAEWDQFETNKRLFGTESTYDESHYTTTLDRSSATYKQREAEATRLAREIEGAAGSNAHIREERGQALEDDGEDEESKYSGVRRDKRSFQPLATGAPNTYTPPARRPPTAQPTMPGAPVDPAIISSQLSRPDGVKAAVPKATARQPETTAEDVQMKDSAPNMILLQSDEQTPSRPPATESVGAPGSESPDKPRSINTSVSPQRSILAPEDPTDGVETKVLEKFREFKFAEKLKLSEKRRAQATQDRTAKLNDLKRFSTNFKLKTPIPVDMVGILAKDPAKQEQIMEKARKEHDEAVSVTGSPSAVTTPDPAKTPSRAGAVGKFDPSTIPPPIPIDRQAFIRGRGGYSASGRGDRQSHQQATFAGRGAPTLFSQRNGGPVHERKQMPPQHIPAPIPLHETRLPPAGPAADQSGFSSPQRSNLHTPTSAISSKFSITASVFRPGAPAFTPAGPLNAPTSPAALQRAGSISRAPSPSAFFGNRRPIPANERPSLESFFNPIKRMKEHEQKRKAAPKEPGKEYKEKDYSANGGIPYAYETGPVWSVKKENAEISYQQYFETKVSAVNSPHTSRSNSTQQIPYHHQLSQHLQSGSQNAAQISTPQYTPQQHVQPQYPHHPEESFQRMPMANPGNTSHMYASPRPQAGQMVFPSPMAHPAQLAYGQQPQYFGAQGGQAPIPMRQYSAQQYMHSPATQLAAPMMVQQQSSGPYMTVPQQYQQVPMYSPSPANAYPQQNGYPSPGRGAPMMMQQGSQQSHHGGQPVMYAVQGQPGQMMYAQQGGPMRPTYQTQQGPYGSSPLQPHPFQQRAMSSGYGQGKMMHQQQMQQVQQAHGGPPMNAPQQPAAFGQMMQEEGK